VVPGVKRVTFAKSQVASVDVSSSSSSVAVISQLSYWHRRAKFSPGSLTSWFSLNEVHLKVAVEPMCVPCKCCIFILVQNVMGFKFNFV